MENNLSKDFNEVLDEIRELALKSAVEASAFEEDDEEIMANIKTLRLVNRFLDLCGAMLERQEELMDKMDEVLGRYPTK